MVCVGRPADGGGGRRRGFDQPEGPGQDQRGQETLRTFSVQRSNLRLATFKWRRFVKGEPFAYFHIF